jgi:glycosyltransferase involved in cell wall biosynthesis
MGLYLSHLDHNSPGVRPKTPREVLVIVAARNEARRIGATLAALGRAFPGAQVWVADDCSTDATAQIARAEGARVVRAERPLGKGGAVTRAVQRVRQEAWVPATGTDNGGPIFLFCDADLAESAAELDALADAIGKGSADLAIGAFATPAGGGFGVAVGFARWAVRRCCGLRARAPISGQRAMHGSVLADVLPFARGFGMELGMTIDAVRAGNRVVELELDLAHRAGGRTLAGFAHRSRQLVDFVRVYLARRS